MGNIRILSFGALLGGAGAYAANRLSQQAERAGRAVGAQKYGMTPTVSSAAVDDVTLTHKVESELFRDEHDAKGNVSVNAANGVVQLRGEVDRPGLIDELV
jgi:osmotically-inducible protein OsmY